MPPVSHPFKQGALIILLNYGDHAPPHVHVKYQGDVGSYRIEIKSRKWLASHRRLHRNFVRWLRRGLLPMNKSCLSSGKMRRSFANAMANG